MGGIGGKDRKGVDGADADADAAAGASAGERGRLYVPRPLHWSEREANDSSVVMAAAGASQGSTMSTILPPGEAGRERRGRVRRRT